MDSGNSTIGFIGAGNMANALIKGLINSDRYSPDQLAAADNDTLKLEEISNKFGIKTYNSNKDLMRKCGVIVLAIKPQVIRDVLEEVKNETICASSFGNKDGSH